MGALALKYPFPERMVTFGGNHIALQPVPIVVFSDMNELEKWRRLVEEKFRVIAANIRWFGPDPFIQGFNWNEEISLNQKFWKNGLKPYGSQTVAELRELPKEFCSNVESIYDIAGSLDYKLKRFDYLKKLRPSRGIVLVTLIGSVLTFFCGVVIPLIHPKVPRILVVWVPAIFYSYFLLYLTIKISVIIR
jgi:hypothetical protein